MEQVDWMRFLQTLLATGLGGLLSFLGSRWALNRSFKQQHEIAELERKIRKSELAFSGFHKLMDAYNEVANLKRHIDEAFEDAAATGEKDMEPWAIVRVIVGSDGQEQPLLAEETSFLIAAEKADILNRAHLIQRRVWNSRAVSQKYNELRTEIQRILEENAEDLQVAEGTKFSGSLTGVPGRRARLLEAQLNNMLGTLMQHLEVDEREAFEVTKQYMTAASEHFEEHFPKFEFDRVAN